MKVVLRICGLLENNAMFGGKMLSCGVERLGCHAVVETNPCQHAKSLGLDEDFSFLAFLGANFVSKIVVSAQEPVSIPTMLANRVFYFRNFGEITIGFIV